MDNASDNEIASVATALRYLAAWLDEHRTARHAHPGSAVDRHLRETGHRIHFGCCAAAESGERNESAGHSATA